MTDLLRAFVTDIGNGLRDFGRDIASAMRDFGHDIAAPFKDAAWLRRERRRMERGE